MKSASMILSPHGDINAMSASWGLRKNGVQPLWGPSLADMKFSPWSIEASSHLWATHGRFSEFDVRSVWQRRPRPPEASSSVLPSDVGFVEAEWLQFQKNVFALSTHAIDALWVNDPRSAVDTENKLIQLRAARRVGIGFPDTLVSNDPVLVRKFVALHGKVVFKNFFPHTWQNTGNGRLYCPTVTVLDDMGAIDDASIVMCPGIYQRYVEKVCDLRVTIIGDRFFPVRITRNRGDAFVDWRPHTQMPDLVARACDLPAQYQARLVRLMRDLGIVFGCVDLAADAEGNLHFFEVNQGGQYIFVEDWLPDLPLLKAMCAMLAQGRTDYSLELAADITLARCRASDCYQEWSATQHAGSEGLLATLE